MLRNMSGLMAALVGDLETACMQNALQRTVNYLLREALNTPPPHIALTMPAPKAVIASTLNLSAETFSRELHRLQDHGLIEIDRRVVYLRGRDGLKRLADGGRLD
jgi:CRP-like cAMP-binding protein